MIEIKKIDNRPLNLLERIYVWEIFKGFLLTSGHFFRNFFNPRGLLTIQYPEKKLPLQYAAKLRTRHRLKVRADGAPKCVACFLCATACPANCIHIEAAEYTDNACASAVSRGYAQQTANAVEKYPAVFNVDLSRCVMCGMCVEACPEDAIAMDTGELPGGALKREDMHLTKDKLFRNLPGEPSIKGAANRLAAEENL